MPHRSSRHSSTSPPREEDDEHLDDAGHSTASDTTSTASSRGSRHGSSDDAEPLTRRRSSDRHIGRTGGRRRSTMIVVVLGSLVVAAAALAAYFIVQTDENGIAAGDTSSTLVRTTSLRSQSSKAEGATSSSKFAQADSSTRSPESTKTSGVESVTTSAPKPTESTKGETRHTATPSTSSGEALKCRKGVGFNKADLTRQLEICWAYNWDSSGGGLADGVMYVPMLWGTKKLDGWEAAAASAMESGATHVLGFNEPDLEEQANLTPAAAASIWSSAIEPLATKGAKLVSPAVSNGVLTDDGKPMGVPWLLEFLDACQGCTIDAVALHWYDKASNLEYFQNYVAQAHANLSKPIWLTEFMGTGSAEDQAQFVTSAVEWLEEQDFIEAYAAFGAFCDNPIANFVDCAGAPNKLGQAYSDAQ
ncbi:hypothetical protein JCM3766R1_003471 [Sporobolomyces carnicolor]